MTNGFDTKIEHSSQIQEGILNKYALVIVDVNGLGTKTFSYEIPEDLKGKIKIGTPVSVSFGSKEVNGFVVGFSNSLEGDYSVKQILNILSEEVAFTPEYMQLLLWTSKHYVCDLNSVIQTAVNSKLFGKYKTKITKINEEIPTSINKDEKRILTELQLSVATSDITLRKKAHLSREKYSKAIRKLKSLNLITVENILEKQKISEKTQNFVKICSKSTKNKRYSAILEILEQYKEISVSEFSKTAKTTPATLKKMEQENLLKIYEKRIDRNPLSVYQTEKTTEFPKLSEEQQAAFEKISKKIDNGQTDPILIHGVTASGKTELYFALMKKIIQNGKNVLFLAPEIAIASMLVKKTAARFGTDSVSLWHSSVSESEKFDIRDKMQKNEVKILVGARSAVFAPLKNIGLIVIDEEHESSYKQTEPQPYYNACEVSEQLAKIYNCSVIKGSATPDICSYYKAKNSNNLIELKERFNNVPLAPVEVINMQEEFSYKGQRHFSNTLIREIEKNLDNKKQTMLLMNRLGYTTKAVCENCGEVITCPNCSVPMTYHKKDNVLKCHWCGESIKTPLTCPKCHTTAFKMTGLGTERVEEIAAKIFKNAKIARFDSESLKTKNSYAEILEKFEKGEIDILIGTQMSAKGLDNENVTLVGVINTDSSFVFPDFKSNERGFQLLTQVAGRAGRGRFGGKVIFQTYNPDYSALKSAKEQNYKKFYEEEIEIRKDFGYPPFSDIIRFILSGINEPTVFQAAQEISQGLTRIVASKNASEKIQVGAATACAYEKMNNEFRYEILIKNFLKEKGHNFIAKFYKSIRLPKELKIKTDISPIDLL